MTQLYAPAGDLLRRMMRRVVTTPEGCWIFTGCTTSRGYGCVGAGAKGKTVLAHRLAMIATQGPIPDGAEVDHLCHDSFECRDDAACLHRRCVNPAHLAVVTQRQNTARRWERGLCPKGHPLSPRPDGRRRCVTCAAEYSRRRRREAAEAMGRLSALLDWRGTAQIEGGGA